jgi:hypothetical protein
VLVESGELLPAPLESGGVEAAGGVVSAGVVALGSVPGLFGSQIRGAGGVALSPEEELDESAGVDEPPSGVDVEGGGMPSSGLLLPPSCACAGNESVVARATARSSGDVNRIFAFLPASPKRK